MRFRQLAYACVAVGVLLGLFVAPVLPSIASRNSSGTYSLPGSTLTTGGTITATDHNQFRSDIATEMTDSLNRSGKGAMLAKLQLYAGNSAAPGLTFDNDTDTGLYRNGSNDIRMGVDTTYVQKWTSTGITFPLATTQTGVLTTTSGITATQSTADTAAATLTGNGTGSGLTVTGGSTSGAAITALGGASNGRGGTFTGDGTGSGVFATGGDSNGAGVTGTGGVTNGKGVNGIGTGSGAGGYFTGGTSNANGVVAEGGTTNGNGIVVVGAGSGMGIHVQASTSGFGIVTTGNTTRAPLQVVPQSATPSDTTEGQIYYDSDTDKLMVYANGAWVALH